MGAIFRWVRQLFLSYKALGQTTERATATLPQTATAALFTIAGGRIMVTQILGEVTVAIQNIAVNARLRAVPTAGAARDICANLNIQAYGIGNLLGITGINIDAMLPPVAAGTVEQQTVGVILKAGSLSLTTDANAAGEVRWTLKWVPIDEGASVVAA